MRVLQESYSLFTRLWRCQSCDDRWMNTTTDDPCRSRPSDQILRKGAAFRVQPSSRLITPPTSYPGSTVGGSTRHDNATAVLSFASGLIACSRSNSVILVVQPTTSACCTHSSPPDVARTSRAAAMQPASSLVVLLPALRLFGDHLHLHLILSLIGCSAMDHHQLLSRAFCFTCQFSRSPSPWRRLFPTTYTRAVSPDFFVFALSQKPFRYRLVPCGSPNRPTATCRLLVPPPLFFITTDLKQRFSVT